MPLGGDAGALPTIRVAWHRSSRGYRWHKGGNSVAYGYAFTIPLPSAGSCRWRRLVCGNTRWRANCTDGPQSSVLALLDGHRLADDFYLKMQADSSKNFSPNHHRDLSVLAVVALLTAETMQTASPRVRPFPWWRLAYNTGGVAKRLTQGVADLSIPLIGPRARVSVWAGRCQRALPVGVPSNTDDRREDRCASWAVTRPAINSAICPFTGPGLRRSLSSRYRRG
jgi:hypothetical protein